MNIHEKIIEKLKIFHTNNKIPNIIFHGPYGSGKKTILNTFINLLFDSDKEHIKNYVMYVNCSHGKGIKFVREELKFFAKTNVNTFQGKIYKIVVLLNADKLSVDAQSAFRRCIELFSGNTRFFIVVEDKTKILKPILSRFCEIYVNDTFGNLYQHEKSFSFEKYKNTHKDALKRELQKIDDNLVEFSEKLYDKGFSCLDILNYIDKKKIDDKDNIFMVFNKIKRDIRSEKFLMLFLLQILSSKIDLKMYPLYNGRF
uniref:AAA+ ATPase domain-containing protein n=1 Tax=viral metagenome TaxID=1070528 RepID=A0A6C0HQR9_9ZZZZ